MQMSKKTTVGLAALLTTHLAMAQSFPPPPPPPDFDSFTAPPPASEPAAGAASSDSGSGTASSSGPAGKPGTLSKKQQSKFAKAGLEDITNENFPETIESFDFPNVELTDVINAISSLTGKNFIIDPGVKGKITIVAPSKITVAEAYKAFLSALAINGFTVVPSGSFLKIKSARTAQRDNIETYSGDYYPNSDQMITRIIHLKHISADQVNRELRILSSKDGEMSVYTATNSLILSDYGSNIDRVMKIIDQLDVPGFEEQLEVIRVRNAKAKDLADLVDKIVNKGDKNAANSRIPGAFSAGVPRFTRSTGPGSGQQGASFMAIPDDRTNSIIVVGNKAGILRMRTLIARLDTRISPEESGGVFVYYVKNGDAKKIAATLQGVTKDAGPKPASGGFGGGMLGPMGGNPLANQSAEIFGGDVKIQADETTNALVITASSPDYQRVKRILDQIDIARDQVYVESVIMEMSAGNSNNWGVGYYQFEQGGLKSGFGSQSAPLTDLMGIAAGAGATLGFASGNTISVTAPDKTTINIKSLLGFITFIKQTTKANILSTPQITAMDGQEATIEVGDKVATKIDVTTGANGQQTSSVQFDEATIKLIIKPFISPKVNTVRMEVQQTVMQPTTFHQAKALEDASQPLSKRYIKTMLVVKNQDTAVIGGLMQDKETEKITKVPLLGDLPIIGWLFKGRESSKDKVNLLVFLTPKILRNPADQKMVLNKKLDERLKFIKSQGGKDVYGDTIDQLSKKSSKLVDDNKGEE